MNDAEEIALRELIIEELANVTAQVESLARHFTEFVETSEVDPPDDEHDPEGATIAWERMQTAALRDRAREHLGELTAALARLDAGEYGTCERCGEAIAVERLMAIPTTRTCIDCAAASTAWPLRGTS